MAKGRFGTVGIVSADGVDDVEVLLQRDARAPRAHGEAVLVPYDLGSAAQDDLVSGMLPTDFADAIVQLFIGHGIQHHVAHGEGILHALPEALQLPCLVSSDEFSGLGGAQTF